MIKKQAYAEGFDRGYEAATMCEIPADAKPVDLRDALREEAFEAEGNSRQYSPFEFLAHDLNENENRSDGLWEAYDDGVASGIKKGVTERLKKEARS